MQPEPEAPSCAISFRPQQGRRCFSLSILCCLSHTSRGVELTPIHQCPMSILMKKCIGGSPMARRCAVARATRPCSGASPCPMAVLPTFSAQPKVQLRPITSHSLSTSHEKWTRRKDAEQTGKSKNVGQKNGLLARSPVGHPLMTFRMSDQPPRSSVSFMPDDRADSSRGE